MTARAHPRRIPSSVVQVAAEFPASMSHDTATITAPKAARKSQNIA